MCTKNGLSILIISLLMSVQTSAQHIAIVNDSLGERVFLLKELEFLIDRTNSIELSSLVPLSFPHKFQRNESYQNKDFIPEASYWIKFPVAYKASTTKDWIIEFYDQTIDHLEAYVPDEDGSYIKIQMGDDYSFSQRTYQHKNFEVKVNEQPRDTLVTYYFKVRSRDFADIRISFRSEDHFIFYAISEYFLYGMFYGMILIICLYNFLVYLAIREIKNIYYIFYILSVALYTLCLDGIGFQYLWPQHPEWNDYAGGVTLYMVIIAAIIFTRRFLSPALNSLILDKALKWMIIARTVLFVCELFFFPQFFTYRTIEIIPLSLIFYAGIRVWYRGYRPARFFVIAYGILFTGFFIRALVYFNIIPITILSHYSLHISFVLEMLFLTFALGDRIRILKAMRDRALKRIIQQHEFNMLLKDKVNRELEAKVRERTVELDNKNHELEESNEKLVRQANEINLINSMLDLDNWKLKNRIKEVLEDRLMEKVMDYTQFKTLYPDKLACYRFLETLKWEKEFHCRKCKNEKYFDGAQKFSRRCTRCGYNESITSYTIFHSIKFPVEKAFYIAYLSVTGEKERTLETLAHQLELRVNTIWGFKHKVMERIQELKNTGKKPVASRWEDVILLHEHTSKNRRTRRGKSLPEPVNLK